MYLKRISLIIIVVFLSACVTEQKGKSAFPEPSEDTQQLAANHIELANGYMELERYETAFKEVEKALLIDPENSGVHHMLATLSLRTGDAAAAEKSFLKALQYKPNNSASAHELGVMLCKRGRQKEGRSYLDKAMSNQFFSRRDLSALRAGECIAKAQPSVARGYFDRALSLNPRLDVALYRTAEVLYLEGYAIQARGFYERFMAKRKQTAQTLLLGYQIEKRALSASQAQMYANQLLTKFPSSPETKEMKRIEAGES